MPRCVRLTKPFFWLTLLAIMKRILSTLLIIILGAALLMMIFLLFKEKISSGVSQLVTNKSETSVHTIAKEILPIGEFASLAYHYTSVVKDVNTKDINGWNIPFTTRKYIFTYDGTMKLGIDGTQIAVEDGEKAESGLPVIRVVLPPIKILTHEIADNSIEVFEQSQTIFNEINLQDAFRVTADRKREMEEKVMSDTIINEARASTEQQFGSLLRALPGIRDRYDIEFVWQDLLPVEEPPSEKDPSL